MISTSFMMRSALIASIMVSGKTFAQNLPDEINHPVYLRTYQNLEQILSVKSAEFEKLNSQKIALEKNISDMEKDQVDLPRRNEELRSIIEAKKVELSKVESEILGLEAVLDQILKDLTRIDALLAQVNGDLNVERGRAQSLGVTRNQVAINVNAIGVRLNQEIQEENQSLRILEALTIEINNNTIKRNQTAQERQDLARDVELMKRSLPAKKKELGDSSTLLTTKKSQLAEAQGKLPGIRASITQEESKIKAIDAELAPKKAKLAELKAELARVTPEVTKLEKENKDLSTKIEGNNSKINATGITALKAKRETLTKEIETLNAQIKTLSETIVSLKEAIKPDMGEMIKLKDQIRNLERSGGNAAEIARLKSQLSAVEARLAPKRSEILRQEKLHEQASIALVPKKSELETTKSIIAKAEEIIAPLELENSTLAGKIAANKVIIDQIMAQNSGLVKEIKDLEAVIAAFEVNKTNAEKSLAALKLQEKTISGEVASFTNIIKNLENQILIMQKVIADSEKALADFPLNSRRLENLIQKLDENILAKKLEQSREEKLLARIRQDRMAIEKDLLLAQNELNRIVTELSASERLIGVLQKKVQEETSNRSTLVRYNQDSVNKFDGLKSARGLIQKTIDDANQEISVNNQDIQTISEQLPIMKRDLSVLSPKVAAALKAMNDASVSASNAQSQYQNRLSLYQRYLSEAQLLGEQKASLGTTDGLKAGGAEGRRKATNLASESATSEAKWEALRRGYVRGEIAGYVAGFETGVASTEDAAQGDEAGRVAGAKRAKDHANMVLKPEFYLEELERRLIEDQASGNKSHILLGLKDEVSIHKAALAKIELNDNIPELSQAEINQSKVILSSLDSLIDQSSIELQEILSIRDRLNDPLQAYSSPALGANAQNADCSSVYKSVKDFLDACKTSYVAKYPILYSASHLSAFSREYVESFGEQIEIVFNSELSKLYPSYLKEATVVGRNVGLNSGKKEIYRQSFSRSEQASYNSNIVNEEARVSTEAVELVQEHLSNNAALSLKNTPRLVSTSEFGISPGVSGELKMLVKNVGSKASTGNSLVKVTDVSSNLVLSSRDAALGQVPAKSILDLSVMNFRISDQAKPGTKVMLKGEIIHPGNHYRASRVETFKLESVIGVNPEINFGVDYQKIPDIATLGIVKKHDIELTVSPKYEGVNEGYAVTIEEVGSNYVNLLNSQAKTERLARGEKKKLVFTYKLNKASKGKKINLKITVKMNDKVIQVEDLQLSPK